MNPQELFTSYYTMLRKEFVRIMRIWIQTLLPPVITTSLYFIVFGTFIGSQLQQIQGFPYIQFIVPGLIMMSVITSSFSNTVSTFYSAKFMRNIDEILVSPTPDWLVILGFVSGGVVRGVMVGILVLGASLFFTHLAIHSIVVVVVAFLATSILFSLLGLLNGVFAKSFDAVSIVPVFVLTPLTYLGGIFYSIKLFPQFWQNVSLFNPVLYMVNAFRYGFLGISDINIFVCFGVLFAFLAVTVLILLYLFRKGIGMKN
jgi:ABC-2 type transport system permease protein